jgi:hypothetical protein
LYCIKSMTYQQVYHPLYVYLLKHHSISGNKIKQRRTYTTARPRQTVKLGNKLENGIPPR